MLEYRVGLQASEVSSCLGKTIPHPKNNSCVSLKPPSSNSESSVLNEKVSIILNDPPCKDGYVRFTKLPLKPLSDQDFGRNCQFLKVLNSDHS